MPDAHYLVVSDNILSTRAAIVARAAVHNSLLSGADNYVVESYSVIQDLWRERVSALSAAGWASVPPASTGKSNLQYARNCPPFAVKVRPQFRPCGRWRVCPNCYGRYVAEIFEAIAMGCRMLGSTCREMKVIGIRDKQSARPLTGVPGLSVEDDGNGRTRVRTDLYATYEKFDEKLIAGSKSTNVFEPETLPGLVMTTRSTVLIVPQDMPIPPGIEGEIQVVYPIRSEQVGELIAWCFPYPAGMLNGDVHTAVEILQRLEGAVLSGASGIFDNFKHREIAKRFRK